MRFRVAVIQSPAGLIYESGNNRAQGNQRDQYQSQLNMRAFQNSVKALNSLKRASISARVKVRNRSASELLAAEAAQHGTVDHRAAQLFGVDVSLLQIVTLFSEISDETAGKTIARPGGIENFFQQITGNHKMLVADGKGWPHIPRA